MALLSDPEMRCGFDEFKRVLQRTEAIRSSRQGLLGASGDAVRSVCGRMGLTLEILSGGQTGVDRAALDAAIERGVPTGGWAPADRGAEDGYISKRYNLKEMPTGGYAERTEQNILDSHGTLILSFGAFDRGTELTRRLALANRKPFLHVRLDKMTDTDVFIRTLREWIQDYGIRRLNIAGPRESSAPGLYRAAFELLREFFGEGMNDD